MSGADVLAVIGSAIFQLDRTCNSAHKSAAKYAARGVRLEEADLFAARMDARLRDAVKAQAATAELIAAANQAAEWIEEAAMKKGLPTAITLPRLIAALANVRPQP